MSMHTEARRSFKHGFLLTEQELRRIFDVLQQQFARLGITPIVSYELVFVNGAIGTVEAVEDIFAFENFGSTRIRQLKIDMRDAADDPVNHVTVRFSDADRDENSWVAVNYMV